MTIQRKWWLACVVVLALAAPAAAQTNTPTFTPTPTPTNTPTSTPTPTATSDPSGFSTFDQLYLKKYAGPIPAPATTWTPGRCAIGVSSLGGTNRAYLVCPGATPAPLN